MYREFEPALAPPWLQGERGSAFMRALGKARDTTAETTRQAIMAWMVERAPDDALAWLSRNRGMARYPGETIEAWRNRILLAWDFWRLGGTLPGIKRWLEAAGYDASVIEWGRYDRGIWAEFSVYLFPKIAGYITDRWDDGLNWDDGTPWNYSLASSELSRIPGLINEIKPAHTRVRSIFYVPGPASWWDDSRETWDDGGQWIPEAIRIL